MTKQKIRVIDAYIYRKTKDGVKYFILKLYNKSSSLVFSNISSLLAFKICSIVFCLINNLGL